MLKEFCIVIPAINSNRAFPNELLRKIDNISLLQRVINKAKNILGNDDIFVVTDSEEIGLVCSRNEISHFFKSGIHDEGLNILMELKYFIFGLNNIYKYVVFLWPYTPLLEEKVILSALESLRSDNRDILITVKNSRHKLSKKKNIAVYDLVERVKKDKGLSQIRAFMIFKPNVVGENINVKLMLYILSEDIIEIKNDRTWWISEKLLKKKKIIFRVRGDKQIGMGHIYRALTLAHEITDHDIIFVCDDKSESSVRTLIGEDYHIEVINQKKIAKKMLSFKPDLIINDFLNTNKEYIMSLKAEGIRVVNFEDLGSGARYADLTINEIYDNPKFDSKNIRWGSKYYFLREEFIDARPHNYKNKIDCMLLTFGGEDPNNLTLKTLDVIIEYCKTNNIYIYIVTGSGYQYKNELVGYLNCCEYKGVEFTYASGVISSIMEKTPIAISSNGRTAYELAYMNIPSIIVSQNKREDSHHFTNSRHGFIYLGLFNQKNWKTKLLNNLDVLVYDEKFREKLFNNMKKISFIKNKEKVLKMIMKLIG